MNTIDMNIKLNAEATTDSRCLQSCRKLLAGIEQAKNKIADEFHEVVEFNQRIFQLAVSEAEALAWQTDYPQLIFPALAMEKVQALAAWQSRQQVLRPLRPVFAKAA